MLSVQWFCFSDHICKPKGKSSALLIMLSVHLLNDLFTVLLCSHTPVVNAFLCTQFEFLLLPLIASTVRSRSLIRTTTPLALFPAWTWRYATLISFVELTFLIQQTRKELQFAKGGQLQNACLRQTNITPMCCNFKQLHYIIFLQEHDNFLG